LFRSGLDSSSNNNASAKHSMSSIALVSAEVIDNDDGRTCT
jgi:hypothetical protein